MTDAEREEYGRFESWIIARRARKIRSIRDPEFNIRDSWSQFRDELLAYFADGGPITEEVWQDADEFWHAGVKEYLRDMRTEKAENQLVTEWLQNKILRG